MTPANAEKLAKAHDRMHLLLGRFNVLLGNREARTDAEGLTPRERSDKIAELRDAVQEQQSRQNGVIRRLQRDPTDAEAKRIYKEAGEKKDAFQKEWKRIMLLPVRADAAPAHIVEGSRVVAERIENAFKDFVGIIESLGGLNRSKAVSVANFYITKKLAKYNGQSYRVNHGGLLDKETLQAAAKKL